MGLIQKPYVGIQLDRGHTLASGLVGCWVMNEKTGNIVNNLSGSSHLVPCKRLSASYTSLDTNCSQGYATDGTNHYTIDTAKVEKRGADWGVDYTNSDPFNGISGDHLGDGAYYNGYLYVASETWVSCSSFSNQNILVFDVSDMSRSSVNDVSAQGHEMGGLCIDENAGTNGTIYIVSYCDSAEIYKYDLSDFSYIGSIKLSLDDNFRFQGIAKKNGQFYISTHSNIILVFNESGGRPIHILTNEGGTEGEGLDYTQSTLRILSLSSQTVKYYSPTIPVFNWNADGIVSGSSDDPFALIRNDVYEEGTLFMHYKPLSFFDYNSIFDLNSDTYLNDFEMWLYATGILNARITSAGDRCEYTLPSVNKWYTISYHWSNSANTHELMINGISRDSGSGLAWTTADYNLIGFGGINLNNDKGNGVFKNIILFDHKISSDQLKELHHNPYCLFQQPTSPELLYYEEAPPTEYIPRIIMF